MHDNERYFQYILSEQTVLRNTRWFGLIAAPPGLVDGGRMSRLREQYMFYLTFMGAAAWRYAVKHNEPPADLPEDNG
jgi:hypothetical protein